MTQPRVSIARLMAMVGLIAVGIAALRSSSQLWASGLFSLALAAFTVAVLAIAYRRGEKRAFWVGFLLCGGVYLVLSLGPWSHSPSGYPLVTTGILELLYPWLGTPPTPGAVPVPIYPGHGMPPTPGAVPPSMPPGGPIVSVPAALLGPAGNNVVAGQPDPGSVVVTLSPTTDPWETWAKPDDFRGVGQTVAEVELSSPEPFRRIGHSVFSLLFALLGANLARRFYLTREQAG